MSLGNSIGRGLGRAAATTVHAAHVIVSATGQFGKDLVDGTSSAYEEHSDRLARIRAGQTPRSPKITFKDVSPRAPRKATA